MAASLAPSILGHSDVSMTVNVYAQVVEESQRSAVEKVAAILDPNGPKFWARGREQKCAWLIDSMTKREEW